MRHFAVLCLAVIVCGWMYSCQQQNGQPDSGQVDQPGIKLTGKYLAHIELDSTTLIASEVVNGLEVPWDLTVGPDGWVWFNEQRGTVSRVNPETGKVQRLLEVPDMHMEGARGLLSKVLHPELEQHPYVYLHYVFGTEDLSTRLVRYTFDGDTLASPKIILDELPGGIRHHGSRMMISPDYKLWMGTGEGGRSDLAQNPDSYHGKVLRMNLDGSVPDDNPIEGSRIWTSGHRNIQGITFGNEKIYISEHGPDTDDEVNLLQKGGNYGWPNVLGYCNSEAERDYCRDSLIIEPIVAFNPVVAPAGMEYYDHDAIPEWKNTLLLTSLRIQTLRVLELNEVGEHVDEIRIFFQQYFGRLRDIAVSPDGKVFLATSNMDWYKEFRPEIHDPQLVEKGDRIIMLQKADEDLMAHLSDIDEKIVLEEDPVPLYLGDADISDEMEAGQQMYLSYCSSCHGSEGEGAGDYIPGLVDSEVAAGNRDRLIEVMLNGISLQERSGGQDFVWEMPAYSNLDDGEIAAILNYIRREFTHQTDTFEPADIRHIREETD